MNRLEIKIDNISMVPEHWARYIIVFDNSNTKGNYYLDLGMGTTEDSRLLKDIYQDCPTLFMWEE